MDFFFLIFCSSPIHCSTQEIVLSKANNFRFLKDDAHLVLQIIRTLTSKQSELLLHKCCSEGNVSYFIMLADNIRGGCWWYSSRCWTFYQYSIAFSCCVIDGSIGAGWHNGIWHGSAYETKMCHWIPPCRDNFTYWHSLTLAEHCWRQSSGCELSEGVGSAFLQMTLKISHIPDSHADFYEHDMQAFTYCWRKCIAEGGDCWKKIVFCSRKCYFINYCYCDLCICCSFHENK